MRFSISGLIQYFTWGWMPVAAVNDRDPRAVTPQFERGNGRGILAADHSNIHAVVRMGVVVVVVHLAQGFAGNVHPVGQIVVADGKGELARLQLCVASKTIGGLHREIAIGAADTLYAVVLANIELVIGRDLAVVFERFVACRFGVGAGERNSANLQQLRGREERHVRGIVKDRIANAALVDQRHAIASLLRLDGGGQSGRPCSHHQEIKDSILRRMFRCIAHVSRLGLALTFRTCRR